MPSLIPAPYAGIFYDLLTFKTKYNIVDIKEFGQKKRNLGFLSAFSVWIRFFNASTLVAA